MNLKIINEANISKVILMKTFPIIVLVLTLLSSGVLFAKTPLVSQKPLEKMQAFSMITGKWSMTVSITEDNGKTWQATPSQDVNINFIHKGMMLEEVASDLSSAGFHMHTLISYDQYRKVYRKSATDDVWGIMDIYEGNLEDEKLVLTNLKSKTYFPVEDNVWRGFRLTLELKANHRFMWIDKTDDDGKSWQPAFKVEYKLIS